MGKNFEQKEKNGFSTKILNGIFLEKYQELMDDLPSNNHHKTSVMHMQIFNKEKKF